MNLQTIIPAEPTCPVCSRCGQMTRIYGIEPHSQYAKTDICTYVCDRCETVEVRIIQNVTVN
jgi:Zn finger protein HypA/HybF involved in hydrogenase expression